MLTKDNAFRIMKIFFDSPDKKFHIREIARLSGLSAPGVLKILKKLKNENLLKSERENVVENISALRNERFFVLKKAYNLVSLFDSGLIQRLKDTYEEPEAMVVFGSYSRGEDISGSDIDIAVVTKKEAQFQHKEFENYLKRKINIYEIQIANIDNEFLNNMANGMVISGYLRVTQ